jgi:ComF family protein
VFRYPVCRACISTPEPLDAEFFCVSCRTPFQNPFPLDEQGRCGLCRAGVRGFDAAYSFTAYEGVPRKLIHLYKYGRIRTLARPLADMVARALPLDESFDCIVPVPLHWMRQWKRGFNQSELLAQALSGRCGITVLKALVRSRSTKTQAGLSNHARRQNVLKAFRARPVPGKRILLIDDVMTTGATATACALALKRAGAERVALLTVARADRRLPDVHVLPHKSTVGENSDHAE